MQRIGSKKFAMMFFYVDSAEELAAKIGVSQTHLSNIERGRVQISLKLLLRIANVLERRLDYFLGLPSLPFADAAPQGSYTVEELGTLLQMLQLLKTTNH